MKILVRICGNNEDKVLAYLKYNGYIITGKGVKVGAGIYQFNCKKLGVPLRDVEVVKR